MRLIKKILYRILKKDMIKLLSKKHGEQFIDNVMETFGMPTNLMDKYDNLKRSVRGNILVDQSDFGDECKCSLRNLNR